MTDSRKLRISLVLIAWLVLVIAAMAYKFIVVGSTGESRDGCTVILIEPVERTFVLKEMRGFLTGVQQLSLALADEDLALVAKHARAMGKDSDPKSPESVALMGKLPLEFKTLGFSVHADFDRLAKDADAKAAPRDLLRQLGTTMQKCVACHDRYQFGVAGLQADATGTR